MVLNSFRIKRYRSIADSGLVHTSDDGITALIGKNESGKSAVLDSLLAFYTGKINEFVIRTEDDNPEIECTFKLTESEVKEIFSEYVLTDKLLKSLKNNSWKITLRRHWENLSATGSKITLVDDNILEALQYEEVEPEKDNPTTKSESEETTIPESEVVAATSDETEQVAVETEPEAKSEEQLKELDETELIKILKDKIPKFVLFVNYDSFLPDTIDLADAFDESSDAEGYLGASNYLTLAGLVIDDFKIPSLRTVGVKIRNANKRITLEFQEFWRQFISEENRKIEIEMELKHYPESVGEKAGKPYLVFWVRDGDELLHPSQRSQGVKWFLSFYLQLKSAKKLKQSQLLLIDEPGHSLHAEAQKDILKVFSNTTKYQQIIYSTHFPFLLQTETLYRIRAVQRSEKKESLGNTEVYDYHELSSARKDTLLPLYSLIGIDIEHQDAIKKKNNVILEEPSAFYYLLGFKRLFYNDKKLNFFPANGSGNVPLYVNLFLGWGLEFVAIVDGDPQTKTLIRDKVKNQTFAGNKTLFDRYVYIMEGSIGIENIFSKGDFRKLVLKDPNAKYTESNAEYMSKNEIPKQIEAMKFYQRVSKGKIKSDDISPKTLKSVEDIFKIVDEKLKTQEPLA